MHILVLGGNGRVGKHVVIEALARGHVITALLRDPSALPIRPDLTIIKGNPSSSADLRTALSTPALPKAVICALSAAPSPPSNTKPPTNPDSKPYSLASTIHLLLPLLVTSKISKLVVLSAAGVGSSYPYLGLQLHLLAHETGLLGEYADHERVEAALRRWSGPDAGGRFDDGGEDWAGRSSDAFATVLPEVRSSTDIDGLKWVNVRAVMMTDGDATKKARIWNEEGVGMGDNISRLNVARFMVDAAEVGEWDWKTPVISD